MSSASTFIIEKELIANCSFTNGRERLSLEERKNNDKKLYLAMLLGNSYRNKVKIHISTTEGKKTVITTVWAYTESFVVLKGNIYIPTEAIVGVDID
jgi:hypothetical protein